jgi:hypothetical protein
VDLWAFNRDSGRKQKYRKPGIINKWHKRHKYSKQYTLPVNKKAGIK